MRITAIATAAVLLLLGGCTGRHAEPKSGAPKTGVPANGISQSSIPESGIEQSSIPASGIPVGGGMPKYLATKVAGGDDGIQRGRSLCYT